VFSGGWTLEAAEAVVSDDNFVDTAAILDLFSKLVNKSLVVVDVQTQMEARYRLLRVVRQYCLDRLVKRGEARAIQNRHMDFYLKLVDQAGVGLMTAQSPYWLKRLDGEQNNLRAALAYGQAHQRYEDTLQLAAGLFWFWQTRGYTTEGRTQLEKILSISEVHHRKSMAYARALWAAGSLAWVQGEYTVARSQLDESVALWNQADLANKLGLAVSLRELGIIAIYQGKLEEAHSALKESIRLLQGMDEPWNLALAFYNQGLVYESQNDIQTARSHFGNSHSLFSELNEPWGLSIGLFGLGRIAGRQSDYALACSYLEKSLELSQKLDDPWSNASALYLLGEIARLQSDPARASRFYNESLKLNQIVGDIAMIGFTLHNLGGISRAEGELERAARLFGAAQSLLKDSINTTSWSLTDFAQCEQDIASLRAVLDERIFQSAWAEGQGMSRDDAILFALT
jgi:tetratricopeptide (TPR) repeat protein